MTHPAGHPEPDIALVGKAIEGDRAAAAAILKDLGPIVRARIATKISPVWQSSLEPDDVMQVTYLEAFLNFTKFKPAGPGAVLAWVTRIAENNLRDAVKELERAKRPDPRRRVQGQANSDQSYTDLVDVLGMTMTTPSKNAALGELRGVLDLAIDKLPPDYGRVIRLYDLGGKGIQEVCAELGKSSGAIYMMLARAREKLASILGSESKYFSIKG